MPSETDRFTESGSLDPSDPRIHQGMVIPCVDCTLLDGHLDPCPTCGGKREHFQPARMADREVQYEMGRETRARLRALRRTGDPRALAAAIRRTLQETLIYGQAWLAGYRGADPETVFEIDPAGSDEEKAEAAFRLVQEELKRQFFELKP